MLVWPSQHLMGWISRNVVLYFLRCKWFQCSCLFVFLFYFVFLIISPPVTVLNAVRCTTRPQTVQPSANGWPNVLTTRRQQITSARTLKMYVRHAHRRARSQSLSSLYAKRVLNDLMKLLHPHPLSVPSAISALRRMEGATTWWVWTASMVPHCSL